MSVVRHMVVAGGRDGQEDGGHGPLPHLIYVSDFICKSLGEGKVYACVRLSRDKDTSHVNVEGPCITCPSWVFELCLSISGKGPC